MSTTEQSRCGYVAIVGRPNVGKSTLMNALVGEKVSIVTDKPHTTRQRIVGVLSADNAQAVFLDTPGHARRTKRVLHRLMSRAIHQAVDESDLVLLVIEAKGMTREDRALVDTLRDKLDRTLLVVNKIDRLPSKSALLPLLDKVSKEPFAAFIPVSAQRGDNLAALKSEILARLPEGPVLFPRDMVTDRDLKFRIAEVIREKLMDALHQEVPYGLAVEVEHLGNTDDGQRLVHALIWLERDSHKPIVIGKGGGVLKAVGTAARAELCVLLDSRVHLELWVKVREHWSDSERELQRLGFDVT